MLCTYHKFKGTKMFKSWKFLFKPDYIGSRSTLSQHWSFQIRRTTFVNYIKFAVLLIMGYSRIVKGPEGLALKNVYMSYFE